MGKEYKQILQRGIKVIKFMKKHLVLTVIGGGGEHIKTTMRADFYL